MRTVIVVGGGPSGMMAAYSAKHHFEDARVILLERNERLGKKLGFTGGGRCNVTANVDTQSVIDHVVKNGKFIYASLHHFGPKDIIHFFEDANCPLKEEDHHRMFPKDNKAQSIIETLKRKLIECGVEIKLNSFVEGVDPFKKLLICNQITYAYDKLILATGGKVLPGSGSDGNGYDLAKVLGHSMTDLIPAEVPLVSNDSFIQEKILQGLSFKDVSLKLGKKVITHDLLFTHFGLSGPAALRMSFYVQKALEQDKTVLLTIDFLPQESYESLQEKNSFDKLLPKRFLQYIESISTSKHNMIEWIKKFPITIYETRGFASAFVTNGGVYLKEIDPKTMRSKLNSDLSFCGELLDISAFTGGYNITAAFATGYNAGKHIF